MSIELADLHCETCDQVTEHELHYSGRLLESTRCTVCGAHLDVPTRDMLPAYLADLEQRVVSKPRRMVQRVAKDPRGYARQLPRAIARQPAKFLGGAPVDLPPLTRPGGRRRYAPGGRPRPRTRAGAPPMMLDATAEQRRPHQLDVAAGAQPGDHRRRSRATGGGSSGDAAASRCAGTTSGEATAASPSRSIVPWICPSTTVFRVSVTGRTATKAVVGALVGAPRDRGEELRSDERAEDVVGQQAAAGRPAAPCPTTRRGRAR